MKQRLSFFLLFFFSIIHIHAQTTVTGTVVDTNGLPVLHANLTIDGTNSGAITDFNGHFKILTSQKPPFSITVNSLSYQKKTLLINATNKPLHIVLTEGTLLDEVVISASRTPERIFESPVTIEQFNLKAIKNTASPDFYDGLKNLKGVDINTNSLTFKSINTRGFATFANTRFMQLVDGMDSAAPALNFPLGNLLGITETDVLSIELLPGAASALYGANAFNGILFMRSKNPFDYPGISAYYKQGITSQDVSGTNAYKDYGMRAAHKFSDVFAAKVNFSYLQGTDWGANDFRGKNRSTSGINSESTRANDIDYDGINVYGDIASSNLRTVANRLAALGLLPDARLANLAPDVSVSRTGYVESDLTDYDAKNMKADWGLYLRPWKNDFEIQYVGKVGSGSTIFQGSNRYAIKDFFLQQHKIELKNDNFFLRGYVTSDSAGDSYDMVFTGVNLNRQWKPDSNWFGEYTAAFIQSTAAGLSPSEAHATARTVADQGRLEPGSPEFKTAFDKVTNDPDILTGSKFKDASKIYHTDANYNFSHLIDFAEIQVGGSFRKYILNSFGSIYTDKLGEIPYSEVGIYTQIQKSFLDEDRLKLTASLRYDKSELFDAFFSPRLSVGYNLGAKKNHNLRASFQTGFRNPDTQALYIGLDVGNLILLGGAANNPERDLRTINNDAISTTGQQIVGTQFNYDGTGAYNNSFTRSSAVAFAASQNPNDLKIANPSMVNPEQVSSFEVGYRGQVNRIVIDFSAYFNQYKDFITTADVINPYYGDVQLTQNTLVNGTATPLSVIALANRDFQAYRTYTNTRANVNSYGAALALTTKVFQNYDLSVNYTYAKLDFDSAANPDFQTNFNTPEHKFKASFGNSRLFDNFGFNVAWRWSDTYIWEATFATGVVPAFHVLDAQVNYTIPQLKSTFKVGASNLFGDDYFTAVGTGAIGKQYYISLTINNL